MKPKHQVIYEDIINKIEKETYKHNHKLPTEIELCDIYKASRMTVNKVLQKLANEGKVKRIRGKGSFVTSKEIRKDILKLTSFTEDTLKLGKVPGSKVVEYKMVFDVEEKVKKIFSLNDDNFLHVIKRVRFIDNEPVALDYTSISSKLIPEIDINKINESLYSYLEKQFKLEISHSDITIKSTLANKEIAEKLNIDLNSPILYIKHYTYTTDNVPFEVCETYYRADKYQFDLRAYK